MKAALLLSSAAESDLELAGSWAHAGDEVQLVLLDAAASVARVGHALQQTLRRLLDSGVMVAAHDDALRRRAIDAAALAEGVKVVDMDEIADLVAEGAQRVVWL
jgi:intracellular sulfur oxidation DsrE/DsrF family protein